MKNCLPQSRLLSTKQLPLLCSLQKISSHPKEEQDPQTATTQSYWANAIGFRIEISLFMREIFWSRSWTGVKEPALVQGLPPQQVLGATAWSCSSTLLPMLRPVPYLLISGTAKGGRALCSVGCLRWVGISSGPTMFLEVIFWNILFRQE